MTRKPVAPPPIEPRRFRSPEEIDSAVSKLERRIRDLEAVDLVAARRQHTGADEVVRSNVHDTIREVFGPNSPEFREHGSLRLWAGGMYVNMDESEIQVAMEAGRKRAIGILNGLIGRLREKQEDLEGGATHSSPTSYFDKLNLHPRILDVSRDLFLDGYHWEAVFQASKALVNYIKERSGRHDLDGSGLATAVFSKNKPILAFNDLSDKTDQDEQEGMMHLFKGAILAIRNPGGHSFPEGPEQRAIEYLSLLSFLAYRAQEAKRQRGST